MGSRHSREVPEIPAPSTRGRNDALHERRAASNPSRTPMTRHRPDHAMQKLISQAKRFTLRQSPIRRPEMLALPLAVQAAFWISSRPVKCGPFPVWGIAGTRIGPKHALPRKAARMATDWTIMEQRMAPEKTCSVFNGSQESHFLEIGAVDGTRTRDPRRDRPVL